MARTSYGLINPLSCGGGTAIPRGDEKTIGQADAPLPCLTAPQAGPRKRYGLHSQTAVVMYDRPPREKSKMTTSVSTSPCSLRLTASPQPTCRLT